MKTQQRVHITKWDNLNTCIEKYAEDGYWLESMQEADERRDQYVLVFKRVVYEEEDEDE